MSPRHCIFAWAFMLSGQSLLCSEDDVPPFAIRPSEPYFVAETISLKKTFYATEIAMIAARQCGPANLVIRENSVSTSSRRDQDVEQTAIRSIRQATAQRFRENAATVALKLHYGLAACKQSQDLLSRTRQELDRQSNAQSKLIQKGVPIPDPLLTDRLLVDWNDQLLENESKQRTLRIQLSELVGSEIACNYDPIFELNLNPSDIDVCDYLQTAMRCRHEIALLCGLRNSINASAIELWESIAAALSGVPTLRSKPLSVAGRIKRLLLRDEIEQEIRNRKQWLETLIEERTNHIRKEVEVAYETKRIAALRWANSKEQSKIWETRVLQLEKIGEELKGNMADQSAARLQALQSEVNTIKRWLDWHLANVDLENAIGTILQTQSH
ncbi:MAG: hypothetical protein ACK56W_22920 [Pirellula sp.]